MTSGTKSDLDRMPPGYATPDVMEFPLLLTTFQVDALERASVRRGLTPGQLVCRAIAEFLQGACNTPSRLAASDGA